MNEASSLHSGTVLHRSSAAGLLMSSRMHSVMFWEAAIAAGGGKGDEKRAPHERGRLMRVSSEAPG